MIDKIYKLLLNIYSCIYILRIIVYSIPIWKTILKILLVYTLDEEKKFDLDKCYDDDVNHFFFK